VRLYPPFHPAAALYTPAMLETLRADFARIPELLAMDEPPQPGPPLEVPEFEPDVAAPPPPEAPEPVPAREPVAAGPAPPAEGAEQLGLF
jgi:DNA polymerase